MRVTFRLCFDGWVCTSIKTGNPRPFQGTLSDQIETTSRQALGNIVFKPLRQVRSLVAVSRAGRRSSNPFTHSALGAVLAHA